MARWGMVIDLDRCNGCQACEIACRTENNVAVGGPVQATEGRTPCSGSPGKKGKR